MSQCIECVAQDSLLLPVWHRDAKRLDTLIPNKAGESTVIRPPHPHLGLGGKPVRVPIVNITALGGGGSIKW